MGSIRAQLAAAPGKWRAIARSANLSDAAALSALPEQQAVGTAGTAFREVWESLRAWPDAVTVIIKADQVFEVHGKVPAGEPSKVSKYFPDFIVEYVDGKTVMYEIKPERFMDRRINLKKWEQAILYCERKGWTFEVLNEGDLKKMGLLTGKADSE